MPGITMSPTPPQAQQAARARDALRAAADALLDRAHAPAADNAWAAMLETRVRALEAAMATHRDIAEAPGGSLETLAVEKPALIPRLERQHDEHTEVLLKAGRLAKVIGEGRAFDRFDPERLALEARIVAEIVLLHLVLAEELLAEANLQEEGGEGG